MQRLKFVEIILLASILGACATEPDVSEVPLAYSTETPDPATLQAIRTQATPDPVTTPTALAKADEVVCTRERSTSSHIPVRRCYTRRQLETQARNAQREFADALSQTVTIMDDETSSSTTD